MPKVEIEERLLLGLYDQLKKWGSFPETGSYMEQEDSLMDYLGTIDSEFEKQKAERMEQEKRDQEARNRKW
jgi:hypothetical protein